MSDFIIKLPASLSKDPSIAYREGYSDAMRANRENITTLQEAADQVGEALEFHKGRPVITVAMRQYLSRGNIFGGKS